WFYKWRHGDASPRRARRGRVKAEGRGVVWGHGGKRGGPEVAPGVQNARRAGSGENAAGPKRGRGPGARREKKGKGTTRAGEGRVAGTGPGRAQVRRAGDQPPVVWRRHRDHHR